MKQLGAGISGSQVGSIVGMGLGEIGSALAAYQQELEASRRQLDESVNSGRMGQAAAFNRQKQSLLRQRDELDAKKREVEICTTAMVQKLCLIEEEHGGAEEYADLLKAQVKKLAALEAAAAQQKELCIVRGLIAQHETLKGEEK
ncbi:hypothetical protein B484DRAFT_440039, partial [Ochromonadaceae sp. CCMP2298]